MRFNSCIFKDPSFLPFLPHVCIRCAVFFFLRHWTIPFSFYANANDPMRRVNWMRWRKDLQNKIELVSACVLSIGHSIAGLLLAIHIDSHKPLVFFLLLESTSFQRTVLFCFSKTSVQFQYRFENRVRFFLVLAEIKCVFMISILIRFFLVSVVCWRWLSVRAHISFRSALLLAPINVIAQ